MSKPLGLSAAFARRKPGKDTRVDSASPDTGQRGGASSAKAARRKAPGCGEAVGRADRYVLVMNILSQSLRAMSPAQPVGRSSRAPHGSSATDIGHHARQRDGIDVPRRGPAWLLGLASRLAPAQDSAATGQFTSLFQQIALAGKIIASRVKLRTRAAMSRTVSHGSH